MIQPCFNGRKKMLSLWLAEGKEERGRKVPRTVGYSGGGWLTDARGGTADRPHHVATVAMGTDEGAPCPFPHQALQLLMGP